MNFRTWISLSEIYFREPDNSEKIPDWQTDRRNRLGLDGMTEMEIDQIVTSLIQWAEKSLHSSGTGSGRYYIPKTPIFIIENLVKKLSNPSMKKTVLTHMIGQKATIATEKNFEDLVDSLKAYLEEHESKFNGYPRIMSMYDDPRNPDWINANYDEDYLEYLETNNMVKPPPKSYWASHFGGK
jgi:hypothetical protein